MARLWGPRFAAAAVFGLLAVVTGAMEPAREAEAQTVEGNLRIVKRLSIEGVVQLAWSPDGRYLATTFSGIKSGYAVWDVQTGRLVRELRDGSGALGGGTSVAFTPDGTHLIVMPLEGKKLDGKRIELALWNIATGVVDRLITSSGDAWNFAVSASARRMAVLVDQNPLPYQIEMYDTNTWELVATWQLGRDVGPTGAAFDFDPNGRSIGIGGSLYGAGASRGDMTGRVWIVDAATGGAVQTILGAHYTSVARLSFLGESGRIATTAHQGRGVTNPATNQLERTREPDSVRIWDAAGRKVASFLVDFSDADTLRGSSDGRFLGLSALATASALPSHYIVWDVVSGTRVGALSDPGTSRDPTYYFAASAFAPDSRRIAVVRTRRSGAFEVLIVEVGAKP